MTSLFDTVFGRNRSLSLRRTAIRLAQEPLVDPSTSSGTVFGRWLSLSKPSHRTRTALRDAPSVVRLATLAVAPLVVAVATAAADPPVTARVSVDRTAIWVGDRVHYVVDVVCQPGVDIVAADIAADRLELTGLEIVSTQVDRQVDERGAVRYRADHLLTTYAFDATPAIGPLALRYRVSQVGAPDAAPSEVKVPGVSLALRSTLPEELNQARLRDDGAIRPLPALLRLAGPLGLGLLALSALPVLFRAAHVLRRLDARLRSAKPKVAGVDLGQELAALRAIDGQSETERRLGYGRLDVLLRRRVSELCGIEAQALTATEIGRSEQAHSGRLPHGLTEVLEECELARYGRSTSLPSAARFSAGVEAASELVQAR